jgi:hypothetical protein
MAITYPLAFPTIGSQPIIQKISMRLKHTVAVTESPYNYRQKVQDFGGMRWEAEVTIRPLSHTEAKTFQAFLLSLNGRKGTFIMGNPMDKRTLVGGATHTVASGEDIAVGDKAIKTTFSGAVANKLDTGDYISWDNRLYMCLKVTEGTPNIVDISPPARTTQQETQAIEYEEPVGTWRMASNVADWDIEKNQKYSFTFSCVEDTNV